MSEKDCKEVENSENEWKKIRAYDISKKICSKLTFNLYICEHAQVYLPLS